MVGFESRLERVDAGDGSSKARQVRSSTDVVSDRVWDIDRHRQALENAIGSIFESWAVLSGNGYTFRLEVESGSLGPWLVSWEVSCLTTSLGYRDDCSPKGRRHVGHGK